MMGKIFLCGALFSAMALGAVAGLPTTPALEGTVMPAPAQMANDRFITVKKSVYHRTLQKDEFTENYIYSHNECCIAWPKQLAGVNDLSVLHDALIRFSLNGKAAKGTTLAAEMKRFLNTPCFMDEFEDEKPAYKEITKKEYDDTEAGGLSMRYCGHQVDVKMDSPSLMAFEDVFSTYGGGAHGMYASSFLIFDRTTNTVFDKSNTFVNARSERLLQILNAYVSRNKLAEEQATHVPEAFYPSKRGLVFVFQPYEIACYAAGMIEVTVPYSALSSQLSPAFKRAIRNAATFKVKARE